MTHIDNWEEMVSFISFLIFILIVFGVMLKYGIEEKAKRQQMPDDQLIEEGPLDDELIIFMYGGDRLQMKHNEYDAFCALSRAQKRAYIAMVKKKIPTRPMTEAERAAASRLNRNDSYEKSVKVEDTRVTHSTDTTNHTFTA